MSAAPRTVPRLENGDRLTRHEFHRRYLAHQMSQRSFLWRFPLWFVVATGLPWALIQVVRWVLRKRNNSANLGVLALFTLVDLAVAWPLLFAYALSGFTLFGMLVLAALMGYYNYDACDYIERRLL